MCERDTICQFKEVPFSVKNDIEKGKGLDLGAEPPRIKLFLVPPGERPLLSNKVTTRRFEQKKYSGIFIDFSYNYFNHNVKPLS